MCYTDFIKITTLYHLFYYRLEVLLFAVTLISSRLPYGTIKALQRQQKNTIMKERKLMKKVHRAERRINRKYKDSLFFFVFGRQENKRFLLDLYNALLEPGTEPVQSVDELEINTIENVIYLGRKNDVSFLVGAEMDLYEHQSTYNPNIPLRGALYWAMLMEKWLEKTKKKHALYGKNIIKIPAPRHIVFYNGADIRPTVEALRLSDAFIKPMPGYEWTTMVYNINPGYNDTLLKNCQALREYAEFTGNVQKNVQAGMALPEAVEEAYKLAVEGECLGEFFRQHRMEVTQMLLTTFDEKEYLDYVREESERIGIEKGRIEGERSGIEKGRLEGECKGRLEERQEGLIAMISTLKLAGIPLDKAYELIIQSPQYAGVSKEDVEKQYNKN